MSKESKAYGIVVEQITELMESDGLPPWSKPWFSSKLSRQCNGESKRAYTGFNAIVLAMQPYGNPHWLTFNQIKSLDLRLKRGSKSVKVFGWFKPKREVDGEIEESNYLIARYYNVFNVEQLEVIPSRFEVESDIVFDNPRYSDADRLFQESGALLGEADSAYYVPMRDKIFMPRLETFKGSGEYYSTLFHELVHWTGHETRLKRFKKTDVRAFRSEEYSAEELCAEMGAVFICSSLGISSDTTLRNSAAYIKGWLSFIKSDPKAFVTSSQRAQKAADYIFNLKAESKVG